MHYKRSLSGYLICTGYVRNISDKLLTSTNSETHVLIEGSLMESVMLNSRVSFYINVE